MAMMEALLKIRADVQGEGRINALGKALGGLTHTAGKVSGGINGLLNKAGGLSGALGALVPVASGAGLVAMGKGAINAADAMNDMSQKTGVSVEQLSRFQQAAIASGTDINAVSGAMIKLNKNMATGNEKAAFALEGLGISAKDASGKLKSADAIMLEVADRFAKMPDGAEKTAAAIALFGKSGADMIPMLNGGSDAIKSLSATMSTTFAKGADQLNDKIAAVQSKLLQLGVSVGTALMPMLNTVADVVVGLGEAFASLPGPLQAIITGFAALAAAFVVLAPAISAAVSLAGVLGGLQLGATIAGWAGIIGPAVTTIIGLLGGILTWVTGTLLPGLLAVFSGPVGWTALAIAAVVAMVIAFREPIWNFLKWLGQSFMDGLAALGGLLNEYLVQPFANLWNNVLRGPIIAMFEWLKGVFSWVFQALYAIAWQLYVQPFINLWKVVLREPIMAAMTWISQTMTVIGNAVVAALGGIMQVAYKVFVQPWVDLWRNVIKTPVVSALQWLSGAWSGISKGFSQYVVQPISNAWNALIQALPSAMSKGVQFVQNTWTGMINAIRSALRGFLVSIANGINSVAGAVNRAIAAYNNLPGSPNLPFVPSIQVQPFAKGGVVNRATLAMVGEGGEREYIIPESKMRSASVAYLNGARGANVLQNHQSALAAPLQRFQSAFSRSQSLMQAPLQRIPQSATFTNRPISINVKTGPVLEFNGGRYVKIEELDRAMRITAEGVMGRLRTPAARVALGIR